jgi:hypothetical protein
MIGLQHRHVVEDLLRRQNPMGDGRDRRGHDVELDLRLRLRRARRFRNGRGRVGEPGLLRILDRRLVGPTGRDEVTNRHAALDGLDERGSHGHEEIASRPVRIGGQRRDDGLDLDVDLAALGRKERLDLLAVRHALTDALEPLGLAAATGHLLLDLGNAGRDLVVLGQGLVGLGLGLVSDDAEVLKLGVGRLGRLLHVVGSRLQFRNRSCEIGFDGHGGLPIFG